MQIQFIHNSNINSSRSHHYSGRYQRGSSQQPQEQYQLLQHPMIVQSRSTDSQLDVESSSLYASQSMKHKEHLDHHHHHNETSSSLSLNQKSNVAVSSFFSRTHPSLLNESSESSSSSASASVLVESKGQNVESRSAPTSASTPTLNPSKSSVTNQRRRRSQDIFQSPRSIITTTAAISCDDGDDHDDDSDDDDDQENGNIKRTRWDSDIYDTHSNGLWIQRSYAFDESDNDDEDDESDENVTAMVNGSTLDCPSNWMQEPLIR